MVTNNQLNVKKDIRFKIRLMTKSPALSGGPFRKGVVEKIFIKNPKKPNSAKRKICKVLIKLSKRKVDTYIPGIGHSLQKFSQVVIKGGRCQDVPGVRYTAVKGVADFRYKESFIRMRRRSLYGIPKVRRKF